MATHADEAKRIGEALEHLTVRAIALWGMAMLDGCCVLLRDRRRPCLAENAPNWIADRDGTWIDPMLLQTHRVLWELLRGEISPRQYQDIVKVSTDASGLDYFAPPLNHAGRAIYSYAIELDAVWNCYWEPATGTVLRDESADVFARRYLQDMGVVPLSTAYTMGRSVDSTVDESLRTAHVLRALGERESGNPLGPPIPGAVVDQMLKNARFFRQGSA
jgi:hypothetical protein